MKRLTRRELDPSLLSAAALNISAPEDSSARQEMLGSHLAQALVIDGATVRRCLTGMERRFGSATFSVKLPYNAEIKRVIEKYPRTVGIDAIAQNPLTAIVIHNVEKGTVDLLELPYHHCKHNHFGFKYKLTEAGESLASGSALLKGTILADSPNIDRNGNYRIGTELNVCFMSIPGIIEDGVVISETAAKKMTATGYESRPGSWGRRRYPLNLYPGPNGEYRPHPEIGDTVREDGLLFAFREYDELLAGVEMAADQLTKVDYVFDRRVYAVPGAKVVDVTARKGSGSNSPRTPAGMELQAEKYHQRQGVFYDQLNQTVDAIKRNSNVQVAPKLHRLLVEGHVFKGDIGKTRPKQMYNLQELDEWRVDVTFEYKVRPDVGSKLTEFHGGKGVICSVRKDEDMPIDQWGNRCEIIMDGNSTMKRMNPGRFYEQWFNAQSLQIQRRLKEWKATRPAQQFYAEAWDYLIRYYGIVSPWTVDILTDPKEYAGNQKSHIDSVVKDGVYHWFPTNGPTTMEIAVKALRKMPEYQLEKGPITYRDLKGDLVTTRRPVIVASVYVMLLEKTGDEWSGVSSTKLQHFGIPAKINKHDKYATPARPMPVRILGESEVRLMVAACGSAPVAELVEMSNSPVLHKHIVANILTSDTPTRIESVVTDKRLIGRGGRNLAFVHHGLEISGVRFVRQPSPADEPRIYPPESGEPAL